MQRSAQSLSRCFGRCIRARVTYAREGITLSDNIRAVEPLGYLDLVAALQQARTVVTDSRGLQKEAYWLGVPCVTLRDETEWTETVASGWNVLADADADRIIAAVRAARPLDVARDAYGVVGAAERVVVAMEAATTNHTAKCN